MKYLVTGAAGFLGSNLCARLLAEGHQVIGLDNLHSGRQVNVDWLASMSGFTFVRHDVIEPFDIACDVLCNLACPASPPHYQEEPVNTAKTAVIGTLHALENAARHNAVLLQASTSEIYGDPLVHPQPETYWGNVNTLGPRACYDEGKRMGETLCSDFTRLGKVDARIIRIFNTYGPRMRGDDGRVVTNFIVQSLSGKPLTISGDGSQTRSFCYVDDLIEGLLRGDRLGQQSRSGQPWESRRVHDARARRRGPEAHGFKTAVGPHAAARRRPQAAEAGYLEGGEDSRLASQG